MMFTRNHEVPPASYSSVIAQTNLVIHETRLLRAGYPYDVVQRMPFDEVLYRSTIIAEVGA